MIDLERCRRAMRELNVTGSPGERIHAQHSCQDQGGQPRHDLIEEAITRIASDPAAMMHEYLYVKNYASFGDQSGYCSYGCGPRHGAIVFSIGRTGRNSSDLGRDHIYLLECVRDFGVVKDGERRLNLCDCIRALDQATARAALLGQALESAVVEAHSEFPTSAASTG